MAYTVDEKRVYKRKLFSSEAMKKLKESGYEWIFSSNVSAAAVRGNDLIIRFHNSSVYRYENQAKNYERLMAAASKGKWVWRFLRRPQVPYQKIGSLPLPDDDIDTRTDEEIMKPRIAMYDIKAVVPSDYFTTGKLPQISINPLAILAGSTNDIGTNLLVGLFISNL